jgi:hypothetical protein
MPLSFPTSGRLTPAFAMAGVPRGPGGRQALT